MDITANIPSPVSGQLLGRVIGIRWDDRSIPVAYRVNDSFAEVPNPLGEPVLALPDAGEALQASFDAWNSLPSSYIDMRIVGQVANDGLAGFDFVNELTFRTSDSFAAIASSPSVELIADATFLDGDDIDEDGDSDVSAAISSAADADGDGDLEFPAGFYRAGTILDNDVQFNTKATNGYRFTVGDDALDTVTRSVDLQTVATHEFGHSHGLSHTLVNQTSDLDGGGATMFPFIDTGDPESELRQRSLHEDDVAWSSYLYQEGSAALGPAALQDGDIAFTEAFGLVKGAIQHGTLNQPVAGASVFAVGRRSNEIVASAFSGVTQLSLDPATGALFVLPDPAQGVLSGDYVLPVPAGNYDIGVEAVDGSPVPAGSISYTAQVGAFYGQQNFNEEFFNRRKEGVVEVRPGRSRNVHVDNGLSTFGIDIVTNDSSNIASFTALNAIGFINSPPGLYYAVAIPASRIAAFRPGEEIAVQAALFTTAVVDASVVPIFSEAMLTTGAINPDGTASIDLAAPLARSAPFVAQETDSSPLFINKPRALGRLIRQGTDDGTIQHLFLVLRSPAEAPFPGISGQPPLVGLSTAAVSGLSFSPRTERHSRPCRHWILRSRWSWRQFRSDNALGSLRRCYKSIDFESRPVRSGERREVHRALGPGHAGSGLAEGCRRALIESTTRRVRGLRSKASGNSAHASRASRRHPELSEYLRCQAQASLATERSSRSRVKQHADGLADVDSANRFCEKRRNRENLHVG